ncbi:hypothetical protein CKF94_02170 [Vibrio coralliilyticus]|uniref:DUF6881 domain-containing protein n=1 Tax=Vibrio coralliilyticus TaxID=190893 RepID=UPI000BAAC145|nr:hypothetical protein [Vibrio coralliilyticus]PAU39888.1 hypothetical protein CKF94_02170 [Vibrio coralliilyticus]
MKYLKVEWLHDFDDEPVLLYSELTDDRTELRKVEVFPNGEFGYAYDENFTGTTQLSDTTIPLEDEIAEDPQFVPELITRAEFEKIWEKATAN